MTLVSFDLATQAFNAISQSWHTLFGEKLCEKSVKLTMYGQEFPMTFEEVVDVERRRRSIERLTEMLNAYSKALFVFKDTTLPSEMQPIMREAACKWVVVQILKLLDECQSLGVDVSPNKKLLAEFLETLKPKDETP